MLFKKDDDRKISRFSEAWLSDASGDATVSLDDYKGYEIVAVQTVPGEDGDLATDLPSANYNMTLIDAYGMDWFFDKGLLRSGTVAEAFCKDGTIPIADSATLTIADAGNAKQGLVNIWIA